MATKKVKKVTIDIDAILKIQADENRLAALGVMDKFKITRQTFANWKKEAPAVVQFLNELSAATGCPINELLK